RGLRSRPREPCQGGRGAVRRPAGGVPQGAGGDPHPALSGDVDGGAAGGGKEADLRREGQGDPASVPAHRRTRRGEGGTMSTRGLIVRVALGILVLATLSSTFYTVSEQEQVVITQFGEPIGQAVTSPGLHVKIPFTQDVNVFDKRWLEWNGSPNQVPTRDKKYIWVETYARWRIANPLLFFQRLRDERGAQSRLDDIIDGETRNVIASHNLIEIVRVSNRAFEAAEEAEDVMEAETMRQVELGRDKITRLILERASQVMPDY